MHNLFIVHKVAKPRYQYFRTEEGKKCTVKVKGPSGNFLFYDGFGKTQKEAKREAAQKAWEKVAPLYQNE